MFPSKKFIDYLRTTQVPGMGFLFGVVGQRNPKVHPIPPTTLKKYRLLSFTLTDFQTTKRKEIQGTIVEDTRHFGHRIETFNCDCVKAPFPRTDSHGTARTVKFQMEKKSKVPSSCKAYEPQP